MTYLTVRTVEDVDNLIDRICQSAARAQSKVATLPSDPLAMFGQMKFEKIGFHPTEDRPLNLVEQINQTWTYLAAFLAAKQLLRLHPDAGGFHLAPGAHASLELDIMSIAEGRVGAETFAAVTPKNNNKLQKDLEKLASRSELHRYVFFVSPAYPGNQRQRQLERDGIEVWSVDL